MEQSTTPGYVGDTFETNSKNFDGYILVEEPIEKTVSMTAEEIVLKYYYEKAKTQLVEKHIDIITGDIIENVEHEGEVGEEYDIKPKEIEGYDLVEEEIEVVYYYKLMNFNLKVDKIIEYIMINGVKYEINGELGKAEVNRSELATAETNDIYPGQSQVLRVVMDWQNGERNIGTITNTADIKETYNEYGISESVLEDNKSEAERIFIDDDEQSKKSR